MLGFLTRRKTFADLSEPEILALAISSEEDDARIYAAYAARLRDDMPTAASVFDAMAEEEDEHRARLIDLFARRFGGPIPLIRREHLSGHHARRPIWLSPTLDARTIRGEAARMEDAAAAFYERAAAGATDAATRRLLGDLARAERRHEARAHALDRASADAETREAEEAAHHRRFVLTWVQPGLAGLMDGSVSTLAPVFATAFATQDNMTTFRIGLAAAVGAGISMGFTEAASDDGVLSGRGSPWKRGLAAGVMTAVGGLGHALPYLIPDFATATALALVIVFVELWAIAWIQKRWMETPFLRAVLQVVLGGALVLAAGILIGEV